MNAFHNLNIYFYFLGDKRFLEMEIKHLKEVTEQIDLSKQVPVNKENV